MAIKKKEDPCTAYEFVRRYHFPIVGIDANSNKMFLIGTCILLRIEKRVFLVTAAHVMNERQYVKNKELWLYNYSNGRKTIISEDIIGNDDKNVPNSTDVAIVELNIKEHETFNTPYFYERCFLDLNRILTDIEYQTSDEEKVDYIVAGYPSSKNKNIGIKNKKLKLFLFLTDLVNEENKQTTEESLLTVSVNWNNKDLSIKGTSLPRPQGMSGGGVWLLSDKSEFCPMLYAISVAHIGSEKKVIAVKMSLVLSILKSYFPGTLLDCINLPILIGKDRDENRIISIPVSNKCI